MPVMLQLSARQIAAVKVLLFVVCLLPLARLAYGAWNDELGANPIEAVIRNLGDWALNFLLITLTVTPLRRASGLAWLVWPINCNVPALTVVTPTLVAATDGSNTNVPLPAFVKPVPPKGALLVATTPLATVMVELLVKISGAPLIK